MSKEELQHMAHDAAVSSILLVRCAARAATPSLAPSRVRLSAVTRCTCLLPFLARKRVIAEFHFAEHAWQEGRTGRWKNVSPYQIVPNITLNKMDPETPVQMKTWTSRGTFKTALRISLGELLCCLYSCPSGLTLHLTCTSARLRLHCPTPPAGSVTGDLKNTAPCEGAGVKPPTADRDPAADALLTATVDAGTSSSQDEERLLLERVGETGSDERRLTFINDISGRLVAPASAPSLLEAALTIDPTPTPAPSTGEDHHQDSGSSYTVRFPDSGSIFVEMLREYERLAAASTTRQEEPQPTSTAPRPSRPLMWCNWALAQLVPPLYAWVFLLDVHRHSIPRLYGEWAFPAQALLWVWTAVVSFVFYAGSWMPAGRVSQQDAPGKEGPACWHQCHECGFPVPDIARHCSVCRVCVWERDHHCPAMGTCLGRDNVQAFRLLYVLAAASGVLYLLGVPGGAWWHGAELRRKEWTQGVLSLCFIVGFSTIYFEVAKRRRRIKQKHPLFFVEQGAHADAWS